MIMSRCRNVWPTTPSVRNGPTPQSARYAPARKSPYLPPGTIMTTPTTTPATSTPARWSPRTSLWFILACRRRIRAIRRTQQANSAVSTTPGCLPSRAHRFDSCYGYIFFFDEKESTIKCFLCL